MQISNLATIDEVSAKVCGLQGHRIVQFPDRVNSDRAQELMCAACGATLAEIRGEAVAVAAGKR